MRKFKTAKLMAGIADKNASLYRRLHVPLGDPAAWIEFETMRIALVRDLEMDRVRQQSHADDVTCPAEHAPPTGLSADRETATAEAVVQLLRTYHTETITADRTLPYIYVWHLEQAEIDVQYDEDFGVLDRRVKTHQEIESLERAQSITEDVMRLLCETIARCDVADDGSLLCESKPLTSERVRAMAAIEFMQRGYSMSHGAIVASAPHSADCHHSGQGQLFTQTPIIVDLFPRDDSSRYWGDCTRTVVHGDPSDAVKAMHAAVTEAKAAATAALTADNTAGAVHDAADAVLMRHGYPQSRGTITDHPSIQHGTGHGIGLDVHEPILLDHDGAVLLAGEVFTVEPGLYGRQDGGVRVEDMLVVTEGEPRNLNRLPESLTWN